MQVLQLLIITKKGEIFAENENFDPCELAVKKVEVAVINYF